MREAVSAPSVAYALACVLLPIAWGVVVVQVVTLLERYADRHKPSATGEPPQASPEYHI
jgi:hypothetical protein